MQPNWAIASQEYLLANALYYASTPLELALLDAFDSLENEAYEAKTELTEQEEIATELETERDKLKEKLERALDLLQNFVDFCHDPIEEHDPTTDAEKLINEK